LRGSRPVRQAMWWIALPYGSIATRTLNSEPAVVLWIVTPEVF